MSYPDTKPVLWCFRLPLGGFLGDGILQSCSVHILQDKYTLQKIPTYTLENGLVQNFKVLHELQLLDSSSASNEPGQELILQVCLPSGQPRICSLTISDVKKTSSEGRAGEGRFEHYTCVKALPWNPKNGSTGQKSHVSTYRGRSANTLAGGEPWCRDFVVVDVRVSTFTVVVVVADAVKSRGSRRVALIRLAPWIFSPFIGNGFTVATISLTVASMHPWMCSQGTPEVKQWDILRPPLGCNNHTLKESRKGCTIWHKEGKVNTAYICREIDIYIYIYITLKHFLFKSNPTTWV